MKVSVLRAATSTFGLALALAPGCMTRPVVALDPTLKTNFTTVVPQKPVKLDVLFMIDNSASMGDKQAYLQDAIPELIERLVTPNCVDPNNPSTVYGPSTTNGVNDGVCAQGQVEFPPVHDLHLGIVSSALGDRGGDLCDPTATPTDVSTGVPSPYANLSDHNDDAAHLLNRSLTIDLTKTPIAQEGTVTDAASGDLYWFPHDKENSGATPGPGAPIADVGQLEKDFAALVTGVGFFGCGIESPLESWYRFLIQPDPYADIKLVPGANGKVATWDGVDATILQQRHDFLRPDSLVAVITLTDENDSEIDVRALGGSAYQFMQQSWSPPRATSACANDVNDPSCTSCGYCVNHQPASICNDPNCAAPYTAKNDWGFDPNLRHVHMMQKYGVDPQFPLSRYVLGLSSTKVPDRTGEYPDPNKAYAGNNDCQNPLFAASLPDGSATDAKSLCDLPLGTRKATDVFFAHIGGVPHQLLHFDPNSAQNSTLSDADWVSILGKNPDTDDYTNIDPHMIESYQPRTGISASSTTIDPVNGYDWITDTGTGHQLQVDREYACIFPLADARDCTLPANANACDCPMQPTLVGDQIPSVCDPNKQTSQVAAKAYPTIRELTLARKMGKQGIVSSICPIKVTGDKTDPEYGYNPAIAVLIDQLKVALNSQCLPQKLTPAQDGSVPCLILATLPTPGAACDPSVGLSKPDPEVLSDFEASQEIAWTAAGGAKSGPDPATLTVCEVQQILTADLVDGSCKDSTKPGWCYVTGTAAGQCSQGIVFGNGTPPAGSVINLQCIEVNAVADGG